MKKRLGIFLFYSPRGILYDYVSYLLADISTCLDRLVIVCNGYIDADSKKTLQQFSDTVVVRPNEGFDFAAWKEGILDICGFDEGKGYDELVLFNDSFFGPLYPFREVFQKMDEQVELDFWGMTSHGAVLRKNGEDRPRYIQTYFIVCRKRMICSEAFEHYWSTLTPCATFSQHVETIASRFTHHFEQEGFRWSVYTPTFDLESEDISKNVSHHMYNSYEMVARRGLPIIKRKTFTMPLRAFMQYSDCVTLRETLSYIDHETTYDVGMIWRYLLANYSLSTIFEALCLRRVLPDSVVAGKQPKSVPAGVRAAVIVHLYYPDLFAHYIDVLREVPRGIDIYITTSSEDKKREIESLAESARLQNATVRVVDNRGRDLSALLVGCRDVFDRYDYICFSHDKKVGISQPVQQGRMFAHLIFDEMLASCEYICGVLELLEQNPYVGLVVSLRPYAGTAFKSFRSKFWTVNYDQTISVLSRLGLSVPTSKGDDCLSVGSAFWCRTKALAPLFAEEWSVDDFPAEPLPTDGSFSHGLERCFPLIAQAQGYATVMAVPESLAAGVVQDYRYILGKTVREIRNNKKLRVSYGSFQECMHTMGRVAEFYGMLKSGQYVGNEKKVVKRLFPFVGNLRQMGKRLHG